MRTSFFIFLAFFSSSIFSQKVKVLDKETGKVVKNASVFNEEANISLTTNSKGVLDIFSFKESDVIFFSHISYALLKIKKAKLKSKN